MLACAPHHAPVTGFFLEFTIECARVLQVAIAFFGTELCPFRFSIADRRLTIFVHESLLTGLNTKRNETASSNA